jgi:hypothetical protein
VAVNIQKHKAVVVLNNDVKSAFSFPHLYSAVGFIERQVLEEDKVFTVVNDAFNDGAEYDGNHYQIFDMQSYVDIFIEDEDEETE